MNFHFRGKLHFSVKTCKIMVTKPPTVFWRKWAFSPLEWLSFGIKYIPSRTSNIFIECIMVVVSFEAVNQRWMSPTDWKTKVNMTTYDNAFTNSNQIRHFTSRGCENFSFCMSTYFLCVFLSCTMLPHLLELRQFTHHPRFNCQARFVYPLNCWQCFIFLFLSHWMYKCKYNHAPHIGQAIIVYFQVNIFFFMLFLNVMSQCWHLIEGEMPGNHL